jgi:hypothetical protein
MLNGCEASHGRFIETLRGCAAQGDMAALRVTMLFFVMLNGVKQLMDDDMVGAGLRRTPHRVNQHNS